MSPFPRTGRKHHDEEQSHKRLSAHAEELRRDFAVAHLDIFGSVARDETGPDSDIDILVEFLPEAEIGLFEFYRLKSRLEEIMDVRVDLATTDALKAQLKEQIMREKIRAA
ncbi:nucleotidyltransferase family protein [Sulfurivermis fontis]|jgi:predicted nucleotidyltransferase|uniref:nucleotidyltransferase family protein n=1 Tax=Sulfurivermis fontis TaxID=1972068 RepID=UPI000FD7C013|nr:nucleotidyltransferase family protein [Sulfurivermis fontis]